MIKTENSGKYRDVPLEKIHYVIQDMLRAKLLTQKEIQGKYCDFYILKIGAMKFKQSQVSETEISDAITNNRELNCIELEYIINKPEKSTTDYLGLFQNLNNREFMCFYREKYIQTIATQNSFIMLMKMKLDNGEYDKDKFVKKLVKEIIKENKNK